MSKLDFVPVLCRRNADETKPKVEANARGAVFDNADRAIIHIIKVDCWLKDIDCLKADYIVSKPEVVDVVVEIKGSNIGHAVMQILSTAKQWRSASASTKMLGGLVIFTRSPESSASLANRKKTLRDKHRIHLEASKSGKTEYRFETFLGRRP
jgi:hypothetical protein